MQLSVRVFGMVEDFRDLEPWADVYIISWETDLRADVFLLMMVKCFIHNRKELDLIVHFYEGCLLADTEQNQHWIFTDALIWSITLKKWAHSSISPGSRVTGSNLQASDTIFKNKFLRLLLGVSGLGRTSWKMRAEGFFCKMTQSLKIELVWCLWGATLLGSFWRALQPCLLILKG